MSEQVTRRTFLRGATAAGMLLPETAFAQTTPSKAQTEKKSAAAP